MKITIYTTTTCPYCKMEKEYLASKGVQYDDILVDKDPAKAQEMIQISGQMGVPFTVITKDDGSKETILGFDKQKLESLLGIS